MDGVANFAVNTRLTRILGEGYRSSEAALKELVDNAWDADARNVWITLPAPLSADPITLRDDGTGMTAIEVRTEYLNIASDKRTRTGERTPKWNRKVKGRKGIGKFAGLTIANHMEMITRARGVQSTLRIDKRDLIHNQSDLEKAPLPFTEEAQDSLPAGTTIVLSELDQRLNFPTPERLRELLIFEYGREDSFRVFVNNIPLSVGDVPGTTVQADAELPLAGTVKLRFTVSNGKRSPKYHGILLKVDGKVVGKPMMFGLDDDDEIPQSLVKRVYGEVELAEIDDFVTADWGGVIENSKSYQEAKAYVLSRVKESLKATHANELNLQKARLARQFKKRLEALPEHRRKYAEEALNRILKRFYGETEERIATIAEVALDAMEQDAYWIVLDQIGKMSKGDVGNFAASLEEFGILELATIGTQARRRLEFLNFLDQLIGNPKTLEAEAHKALEANLWILGRSYAMISSNKTLRRMIGDFCGEKFSGPREAKRPDLLLAQIYGDSYLLIEFKRPSHQISREDIAQAEQYRDDLSPRLSPSGKIEIMMIGAGRQQSLDPRHLAGDLKIHSYTGIISSARSELEWLVRSLEADQA